MKIWDLESEKIIWNLDYYKSSQNSNLEIISHESHNANEVNTDNGQYYSYYIYSIVFSPDGTKLAVLIDNTLPSNMVQLILKVYDTITGVLLMNFDSIECDIIISFSPDSSQFIVYEKDSEYIDVFNTLDFIKIGTIKCDYIYNII